MVLEKGTHREGADEDFGGDVVTEPIRWSGDSVGLFLDDQRWKEIQPAAHDQDRSLSWMVQKAWLVARGELKRSLAPMPVR